MKSKSALKFQVFAFVTEELRYSLLMLVVHSQCYYSWQLCLDGFPQVFYGVFQVLAGLSEELRYSLPILVVYSQCYCSWQLCLDGFPQKFYGIF